MRGIDGFVIGILAFALVSCGRSNAPGTPSPTTAVATGRRTEVTIAGPVRIGGILWRPEGASTPRPAIIVLHGWQSVGTNGAALVESRARRYSEDGYVALALSMRGWPPSAGVDDCGLNQPDDVAAAVRWLGNQPGVDSQRIGIVGFSQGGQVALLTATRAPIRAVVAYYPVTDVALWKHTTNNPDIPGYITTVCEPGGVMRRSPRSEAPSIASAVLLIHGDADRRVPTEQSVLMRAALEAAGGRVELLLVPGAEHGFTVEQEALARPVADRFLAAWLR